MAITNDDEFKAWLADQPQTTHVAIASRAALRAFPAVAAYADGSKADQDLLLSTARAIMTSTVAAMMPTANIKSAAAAATYNTTDVTSPDNASRCALFSAVFSAAIFADRSDVLSVLYNAAAAEIPALVRSPGVVPTLFVTHYTGKAASAAAIRVANQYSPSESEIIAADKLASGLAMSNFDKIAMNKAVELSSAANTSAHSAAYSDCAVQIDSIFETDLWHGNGVPTGLDEDLATFRKLATAEGPWAFWAQWYQGFLTGKPMNWSLLERIALIPDDDWEKTPEHIAGLIADIRKDFGGSSLDAKQLARHVKYLIENAKTTTLAAEGTARLIDDTCARFMAEANTNEIPEELQPLWALPKLYRQIAFAVNDANTSQKAKEDKTAEEIQRLKRKVSQLEAELVEARSKPYQKPLRRIWSETFTKKHGGAGTTWRDNTFRCTFFWLNDR